MEISQIKICNFRAYKDEVSVNFNNLNVFVGKNDIGKSTILEALDIFFNDSKGTIKLEKEDINKDNLKDDKNEITISVVFDNVPANVKIDSTNSTTLQAEYLLRSDGKLEVIKKYANAGKEKVYIKANHPTNANCSDLLLKKNIELKKLLKDEMQCNDKTKNACIRSAIWTFHSDNLEMEEIEIDASKEDAKNIWLSLKKYLPLYTLFQSDRKNSDGDNEVQDPMKLAVQEILKDQTLQDTLNDVAVKVKGKLEEVAKNTLNKLNEMNSDIANSLNPVIPSSDSLKWQDVFKSVSISGDDGISINKRGSGVKRLVLLNFFRAEADRRRREKNIPNIIYAVEEPETSQHPLHQRKLIEAFKELSKANNTQVILTTHSPNIVKLLNFENLHLIKDDNGRIIQKVEEQNLPYPSLNEVNFSAFGESNEEYHNELYGFLQTKAVEENENNSYEKDFDSWLVSKGSQQNKKWIKEFKGNKSVNDRTIHTFIRNYIHHPENTLNEKFSHKDLQESIQQMRNFINLLD